MNRRGSRDPEQAVSQEVLRADLDALRQRCAELEQAAVAAKRTEAALAESEEKYRQLFTTVSDAIIVFDAETRRFLDANESALRLYGYTRDEFLRLTHGDITAEPAASETSIRETLAGVRRGVPLRYHVKKDGTVFPVEISPGVFVLGGRRVVCSVIRDITDRRRVEDALRNSEASLVGGETKWVSARAEVEFDEGGTAIRGIGTVQDITERKKADQALRVRSQQLEALRAVSAEIARELDLPSLLSLILRRAGELLGVLSGAIFLWDEAAEVLVPRALYGEIHSAERVPRRLGEGLVGAVAQCREGMLLNEYRTSPYRLPLVLAHTSTTAALAEPLLYRERLLGVLTLNNRGTDRRFTDGDLELLRLFTPQAAVAIENARLFTASERAAREARSLFEVAHSLTTSLDPMEVLQLIVGKTRELLGTPHAQVVLWDEATQTLRLGAAYGSEAEKVRFQQFRLGEGVNGIVAQTRAPLIVNDYQAFRHRVPELTELTAVIGIPLLYRGQLLGVLTSHTTQPGAAFSEDHLALLTSFADQAAIAIENARLYEQVRRHAEELEEKVADRTKELQAANTQLEAANADLEAFSYSVSHDLRTPLISIDGFSRLLLKKYGTALEAQGKDYLQRVRVGAQRMGELIDALLALARVGRHALRRELVDLSALARAISRDLGQRDPRRAAEVAIQDGLLVQGDARLLRALLENLLGNAWKFTAHRRPARIEIGRLPGEEGAVVYFVRDNGAGFDMADADKLFGVFRRLHNAQEFPGTGIGLATVQRIVQRHGGRVWAEGVVEGGATFFFTVGAPDPGPELGPQTVA